MRSIHSYLKKVAFIILILAPAIYIFYLINLYGINVPFWDEWEFVPFLVKAHAGTLKFFDLWVQHNEHRMLFPRLIMLSIIYASNWNITYQLYANFILAALTFFVLYLLLRSTFNGQIPKWLLVILSLLIFSPAQWENWAGGLTILFFLNVLSMVIATYALIRWGGQKKGLIVAMIFAVVASYSTNNGLLTWIAVAPIFVRKIWRKGHIIAWIFAFILTVIFYYCGYTKPSNHPSLLAFVHHPYDFAKFVLAYIGAPLGRGCGTRCSICLGALLLSTLGAGALYFWLSYKERVDKILPWLAIGLYAFLTDLATGVGRIGFGLRQSLSDRYATFSTLFTISALVVAALLMFNYRERNRRAPAKVSVVTVCILLSLVTFYALTFFHGVMKLKSNKAWIDSGKKCLLSMELASDECLQALYPDSTRLKERVGMLKDSGLLERMWWYQDARAGKK